MSRGGTSAALAGREQTLLNEGRQGSCFDVIFSVGACVNVLVGDLPLYSVSGLVAGSVKNLQRS